MTTGFFNDLRYGLRQIRGNRAVAFAIIISLALGIGANTAVFSLVHATTLRDLPIRDPGRLVVLQYRDPDGGLAESLQHNHSGRGSRDSAGRAVNLSISWPSFVYLRAHARTLSNLVGFVPLSGATRPAAVVNGEPMFVDGDMVSADYFPALGVAPVVGRAIGPDDERPGAPRVGVISDRFWSRAYARRPAAVGQSILLNRVPVTIIGVAPPSFAGLEIGRSPDIWIQMGPQPGLTPWGVPEEAPQVVYAAADYWWLEVVGRLRPDVTVEQARIELDRLFRESLLEGLDSAPPSGQIPPVMLAPAARGLNTISQRFSKPLAILTAVVGLVLLVACANVATLLLARATARRSEMAVRLAVGAPRFRLVRQLLAESFLYACLGCALGLLLALWSSRVLLAVLVVGRDPIPIDVPLEPTVLAFTVVVLLATTLLSGLAPALGATRLDLGMDLSEKAATAGGWRGPRRLGGGKLLVVAQLAMSLPLVIGAGLFLRTLDNLERQPLGFDPEGILLFRVDPTQGGFKDARLIAAYADVQARVAALPGVRGVTASRLGLITGWANNGSVSVEGEPPGADPRHYSIHWNQVMPGFFETLKMPVLLGRALDARDAAGGPNVAVVNEALARQFFPGQSPIGRRFWYGRTRQGQPVEVVGVVRDAKYTSLRRAAPPTAYVPHTQSRTRLAAMVFEVRATSDPMALVPAVTRVVRDLLPGVPVSDVRTQTQQIAQSLGQETMYARLFGVFGGITLALACVGLYGTTAFALGRRTREIGIRIALGAASGRVLRETLVDTLVVTAVGVAGGGLLAWAGARFVRSLLFEITPLDPLTLMASILVLASVAVAAGYVPARRASRLDPMQALREG